MVDGEPFDEMLELNPLSAFSIYTDVQVRTLRELGANICGSLDHAFEGNSVDSDAIFQVYGQFWLWVLGAFEVVRTMYAAQVCFSQNVRNDLSGLKKDLAFVRIPFAKQQYAGESTTISNEASMHNVDVDRRDVSYRVRDRVVSVRRMIADFDSVLGGIRRVDVLRDLRDA